jgi:hypothetical protein
MSPPFIALENYGFTMADMDHVEPLADFQVVCSSKSAYHPALWSFLDEQDVRHKWWNPKNSLVLDVGAAYGSYTLPALANGCEVIAWSPPYNVRGVAFEAAVLRRSAELNGWAGHLTVLETGLADRCQTMTCDESGPFLAQPLDDLRSRPAWLKIDAEGAELAILRGGQKTLRAHRPKVLLENHLHLDPDCERKCYEFLQSLGVGYRRVGIMPGGVISHSFYECT